MAGSGTRTAARWLWLGVLASGVYGGYFGAAQGVILLALLGIFLDEDLQRVNARQERPGRSRERRRGRAVHPGRERGLDGSPSASPPGSLLGGLLGASIGRRLPPIALRVLIVIVGVAAIIKLL